MVNNIIGPQILVTQVEDEVAIHSVTEGIMSVIASHAMGDNPMDVTNVVANTSIQAVVLMAATAIVASLIDTAVTTEEGCVVIPGHTR